MSEKEQQAAVPVPELDYRVLTTLADAKESVAIRELANRLEVDQSQVSAVCLSRASAGQINVEEIVEVQLRLGAKGKVLAGAVFPERAIIEALSKNGGQADMATLPALSGLEQKDVGQSLRWLKLKGWAEKAGKEVKLLAGGEQALGEKLEDERLVEALVKSGTCCSDLFSAQGINVEAALKLLKDRKGCVEEKTKTIRMVSLSDSGRALVSGGLVARKQVNQLTSEMLRSGEWRNADLRPYDVTLAAEPVYSAKEHPLVSVFNQTRRVFLEMGFSEIVSGYVESSFWDFDALFQPQDHPARDMQDTFYVGRPAETKLPAKEVVDRVRRTHQDGGDTGSVGWRYRWNEELARRPVLRTHTTASTIRALAEDPNSPRKVFCVGPVFRRETVDYKHLPVFHQVDGVIIDEKANFATLLGTLRAFYKKMGFERFQFRPAFFPYTEPSVEIFVWSESKSDWVEMGGAGMFRPEVTEPLGCKAPVIAWGLGLERLAMFRYQLSSIGELYRARMSWLKETPLCR
jgi:phenylalanyl-tRNA synthetase alpha chain